MKYILDTDTLSYFVDGNVKVIKRVLEVDFKLLCTTIFNYAELKQGVVSSKLRKLELMMSDLFGVLPIENATIDSMDIFAKLKSNLISTGNTVMDFDILIASIAIANDYVLVTNNEKHFKRFKGLKLENWVK